MTSSQSNNDSSTLTMACELSAIPADERETHRVLVEDLFSHAVQETHEFPDGYGFRFAAELYPRVSAFVANERRCCPFIAFNLDVPPQQTGVWLRMTGTEEVKAFLRTTFLR